MDVVFQVVQLKVFVVVLLKDAQMKLYLLTDLLMEMMYFLLMDMLMEKMVLHLNDLLMVGMFDLTN